LDKVPLIKELVNTFVDLFPYLSIDIMLLLHKKISGDGFQGLHKDLALGSKITKTIVVSLACIIKSEKGKEEQEPWKTIHAERHSRNQTAEHPGECHCNEELPAGNTCGQVHKAERENSQGGRSITRSCVVSQGRLPNTFKCTRFGWNCL
jgi:hypothetical protein